QADAPHAQIVENLSPHAIIAKIGSEAEFFVRLDGVQAMFLEFVSMNLGGQSDPSAFLAEIKQDSALRRNALESLGKLPPAIAALGKKDIAGEAFGMHTDEDRLLRVDRPFT